MTPSWITGPIRVFIQRVEPSRETTSVSKVCDCPVASTDW
jgi:hypothetical protein